jgi:hypothetical protein
VSTTKSNSTLSVAAATAKGYLAPLTAKVFISQRPSGKRPQKQVENTS